MHAARTLGLRTNRTPTSRPIRRATILRGSFEATAALDKVASDIFETFGGGDNAPDIVEWSNGAEEYEREFYVHRVMSLTQSSARQRKRSFRSAWRDRGPETA